MSFSIYLWKTTIKKGVSMTSMIKEYVEEMKNISSLMLDLAYSSVFFFSKDIASEVLMLYRRMEEIEEKLFITLLSENHPSKKKTISILEIMESTKRIAQAAKKVAKLVIENEEVHPIIREALKESDESITRAVVLRNSILENKTIGDLRLRTETGIYVIAIRRGKQWIFKPCKTTKITRNDNLIGIGTKASCRKLFRMAEGGIK